MKLRFRERISEFFAVPLFRRIAFHLRRLTAELDRAMFVRLAVGLFGIVLFASLIVTLVEGPRKSVGEFFSSLAGGFYWAVTTVMGSGDASYVHSPVGYVVSWLLVLFGVAIVATITGALVGALIDYLIKEGQGMGAAGYRNHIVVCGWNPTARELIAELMGDDYSHKIVLIHNKEKSPAGSGVYFVNGDATDAEDLRRAGIEEALAAIVCPSEPTNDADMRSILTVMAIESIAPHVRTVVEANNPAHVEHFKRAHADEIVVTSRITSRLMARSSLYPGLTDVVTDIVSGGAGSELYRVRLDDDWVQMDVDALAAMMRTDHSATLLAVCRGEDIIVNPHQDFVFAPGDDLSVVAQDLGELIPADLPVTLTPPAQREATSSKSPSSDAVKVLS